MRFTLVDKIVALEAGKSITTIKNLSLAEEYLADHFPGFPVMPGVLMIEALVQAGAWLARFSEDFANSTILLKQARNVKFASFVAPGQTLIINAAIHDWSDREVTIKGSGTVDGKQALSAKLTLERLNLRDRNPEMSRSDEYQVRKLRDLFAQLWRSEKRMETS
jgi:3-hydroxyacyl-[acyl-carrier-protein] dehydratase